MAAAYPPLTDQELRAEVERLREEVSLLNAVIAALLPELRLSKRAVIEVQQAAGTPTERVRVGRNAVINAAQRIQPADGS